MSPPLPAADRQSEIILRGSEQSHRRTTEDCCFGGRRNRQCLDLPYTFERPHVEGIVASQEHALRLARGYQKIERRLSMHNGVEQELVQRRLRRRFQSCPRLCSDLPSVIEAFPWPGGARRRPSPELASATASSARLPPGSSTATLTMSKLTGALQPPYGSWLNTAESELAILSNQCLDRRIADRHEALDEAPRLQGGECLVE